MEQARAAMQDKIININNQESGYCSNVSDSDEKSIDFCERVQHHLIVFS
ncbi:MAG: hypothetical protein H0V65_01690 [Chitinophagales bacterium]|nr:hypothetical protein [Chitinophagales bacterium]